MDQMFLILTADQAAALRGPTSPGAALDPLRLTDGETWVLPAGVLDDPAHAGRHAALAALERRPVAAALLAGPVPPQG